MKKRKGTAIVFAVLALSVVLSACAKSGSKTESSTESSAVSQESTADVSQTSLESAVSNEASKEQSKVSEASQISESPEESSADESGKEQSKVSEASQISESPEESSADESSKEQSSEVSADEPSEQSSQESESEPGYYFDDEQISVDYHHATEFTDDDTFNSLFAQNDIDKALNDELKMAESVIEMRSITQKYAEQWKSEQQEAYLKLYDQLQELPEEQEKLVESQSSWNGELDAELQKFIDEASSAGSSGMLAADSAILNYYKGRAAVLYYQIYLLRGSYDMN